MWRKFYTYQAEETGAETGSAAGASLDTAEGLSDSSDDSSVNWDSLDTSFDEPDVEGDLEVIETSSPAQTSTPSEPATPPAQAAPPAAPAAPSSPAVQSPEAPVPPVQSQSAPPPQTQESGASAGAHSPEVYQNWRTARISDLEKYYTFSEDESAALLTEPELVLPKLAARVHMEVLENSMRAMQAMVPVMMEQVQQHKQVEGQAKTLFSSINPDLADPRLEPVIMQLGMTYRQMNRTAGPEEASRAIGNLVRAALNMQPPQVQQNLQSASPAPAPVPFAPVRGGGGGNRPITSGNQFEQLASEFLMDED